jgi:nitrate reductase cytochrome c-type subunit
MAHAEKAAADPSVTIEKAKPWDGDFFTTLDLFITKDRATCLSCHEKVVGMPANFRSIDVKSHLADQGAENIDSPDVCFECHTGHSPGI